MSRFRTGIRNLNHSLDRGLCRDLNPAWSPACSVALLRSPKLHQQLIPMSFQDETETRRIFGRWRGASETHIRSGLTTFHVSERLVAGTKFVAGLGPRFAKRRTLVGRPTCGGVGNATQPIASPKLLRSAVRMDRGISVGLRALNTKSD